ncbi:MAG: response regulator [Verrucomicrobiia bacterium]|jgi:DNA-binding NtrC family response regulator
MSIRGMNSSGSSQQLCILAIDDELDSLVFLKSTLERQGYRVFTAASPQEAIRIYREKQREIAMVLLDFLVPPKLSDFVFDELQRLNPDVRVVLLTGFEEPVADKLFQKGLWGYLQKPFRAPELARKVQDAIRTPSASSAASPSSGSTLMSVR